MKTAFNGQFEPTFYKNIDLDDILNYPLNIRKFQNHNARSLVNYFQPASTITVDLFAQEMKYLHDNGFRVLLLNQLSYDPNNKVFVLKNVPLPTYGN
jgi:hypothetical protein